MVSRCAEATEGRPETWISRPIQDLYQELHLRGLAHSVECWREDQMVGSRGNCQGDIAAFCHLRGLRFHDPSLPRNALNPIMNRAQDALVQDGVGGCDD